MKRSQFNKDKKMLDAYLVSSITVNFPNDRNKHITFDSDTPVKVNYDTGVAWIEVYQVVLERGDYSIIV